MHRARCSSSRVLQRTSGPSRSRSTRRRRSEMSTLKDFRFQVQATPLRGRRVRLSSDGKTPITVVTPPEFRDGTPGLWSPEDLLVASVVSCYVLTLDALAARRELTLEA